MPVLPSYKNYSQFLQFPSFYMRATLAFNGLSSPLSQVQSNEVLSRSKKGVPDLQPLKKCSQFFIFSKLVTVLLFYYLINTTSQEPFLQMLQDNSMAKLFVFPVLQLGAVYIKTCSMKDKICRIQAGGTNTTIWKIFPSKRLDLNFYLLVTIRLFCYIPEVALQF